MTNPRVLNAREVGFSAPNAVYVGRPTDFGNPFSAKHFGREEAIRRFEALVNRDESFKTLIRQELKGKDLICWCAPLACHADILLRVANEDNTD